MLRSHGNIGETSYKSAEQVKYNEMNAPDEVFYTGSKKEEINHVPHQMKNASVYKVPCDIGPPM
jgi:hypothetical protein